MTDICAAEGCTSVPEVSRPVLLCRSHRIQVHADVLSDILRSTVEQGGPDIQRSSKREAQAAFLKRLKDLFSEGSGEVGAWDFLDTAKEVGRSRSWVYYCLDRMTSEGFLERDGTVYRKKES